MGELMTDRYTAIMGQLSNEIAVSAAEYFLTEVEDVGVTSPIEKLMCAGLLFCMRHPSLYGRSGFGPTMHFALPDNNYSKYVSPDGSPPFLDVVPQMKIGVYTADFFVRVRHWKGGIVDAVIECDGHDFHERTKQQAAHDRSRDRYMQSKGLLVLRYTGSEIHADPFKCAGDALGIIMQRAADSVSA
jgi:very-short-patch-repair endonuclease